MLFLCGHGSGHFPVPGVSCHKPVPGYDFPYIRHIPAGAWRRDLLDRILSCHGQLGLAVHTGYAAVKAAVAIVLGIVAVFELPQGMFAWIAGKLRQIPACCRRNGR